MTSMFKTKVKNYFDSLLVWLIIPCYLMYASVIFYIAFQGSGC